MLTANFLSLAAKKLNLPLPKLTQGNMIELQGYDWPGNVRELQNVIERAVITSRSGKVSFNLSKGSKTRQTNVAHAKQSDAKISILTEEEMKLRDRENILNALNQCNWKITGADGAAELLEMKPTTLHSKIKKMGLKSPKRRVDQQ